MLRPLPHIRSKALSKLARPSLEQRKALPPPAPMGLWLGPSGPAESTSANHCRHCHSAFAACPFPPDAARPDFGGLVNAFSPADPDTPILNSETAIVENANDITFAINAILGEALDDVMARIEVDFASSGADKMEVKTPILPAWSTTPTSSFHSIALPGMKTLRAFRWMTCPLSCGRTKSIYTLIPVCGRAVRSHPKIRRPVRKPSPPRSG